MSLEITSEIILDLYNNQKLSPYEIATKLNTYPNKVRRLLKKLGVQIRDKSEAQSLALTTGRHQHPTKGTTRSNDTKVKISEKVSTYWQNLPDDLKEKRAEQSRDMWNNMTDREKELLRKSAAEAIRAASKDGSKIEKFLRLDLTKHGFNVIYHKKSMVMNENLEMDLFIPEAKTVVEIDGPTHFLPIWGEESLKKHIKADLHKNGLLLGSGYVVIRIKYLVKNLSEKNKRDISIKLVSLLNEIKKDFPKPENRFIELEMK